jgi:hypothetical protein
MVMVFLTGLLDAGGAKEILQNCGGHHFKDVTLDLASQFSVESITNGTTSTEKSATPAYSNLASNLTAQGDMS